MSTRAESTSTVVPCIPKEVGWYWWRYKYDERRPAIPVEVFLPANGDRLMVRREGGYADSPNYEWGARIPKYDGPFTSTPDTREDNSVT